MKPAAVLNSELVERQLHCARCDERKKLGIPGPCVNHTTYPAITDPRLQQPQLPALQRQKGFTKPEKDEIKNFALEFFRSDEYKLNLKARILAGKADTMEKFLMEHAYGAPVKKIEIVENPIAAELQGVSTDELLERANGLIRILEALRSIEPLPVIDVEAAHASSQEQTKSSEAA